MRESHWQWPGRPITFSYSSYSRKLKQLKQKQKLKLERLRMEEKIITEAEKEGKNIVLDFYN